MSRARAAACLRRLWDATAPRYPAHAPDYWLITILLMLVMFGTVMVFSASFTIGLSEGGNAYYFLIRHLIWATVGLAGMAVTYTVDYHVWRRFSILGMLLVLLALGAVLVPGIGTEAYGAQRWIVLGPLSLQPSEVAKPVVIIYLADWLAQKGAKVRLFSYGLVPFSVFFGLLVGLLMLQPDLGTSILLATVGVSMFLVAGARLVHLGLLSAVGTVAFLVMALGSSYRRARILAFLNPDANPDLAWQLIQARAALASGGIFGLGLGASRQKFAWLPFAQTDAIFAVIGEELGLIGCAALLLLFVALAWRGYRIAKRAPDTFGALVAVGVTTWIVFQAGINLGGITTTIPFTGIPLPFISYGGTSLAVSLTAIGLLLNISRQTLDREPAVSPAEHPAASRPRTRRARTPVPAGRLAAEAAAEPARGGAVRSLDGPGRARAGSFGRGPARARARGTRPSRHWR
ncbi:MAG: putative lipid II flippase FtsW [Sphaerobacter sp.]|nr:putative lipid II flippase FtsW [Sphaerobacter sp.]